MSYNLTNVAELKDIPESDMEQLSQSQSVKSDSDPDYVPPSSSSADELSGSGQSENSQVINIEQIYRTKHCKVKINKTNHHLSPVFYGGGEQEEHIIQ